VLETGALHNIFDTLPIRQGLGHPYYTLRSERAGPMYPGSIPVTDDGVMISSTHRSPSSSSTNKNDIFPLTYLDVGVVKDIILFLVHIK